MNYTLLILAGGLGTRFNGLKQITTVDDYGHILMEYSIYDAVNAGFNKIVFVINSSFEEDFKNTIFNKLKKSQNYSLKNIRFHYVVQETTDIPKKFNLKEKRTKPWGTAHAIYSARNIIDEYFCIINADDFYGKSSYEKMYENIKNDKYLLLSYILKNTISENGHVNRGECKVSGDNLLGVFEKYKISYQDDNLVHYINGEYEKIDEETLVSMNMIGFRKNVFDIIEILFDDFLSKYIVNEDNKTEFGIPLLLRYIIDNVDDIKVRKSDELWYGMTYQKDLIKLKNELKKLVNDNIYPEVF